MMGKDIKVLVMSFVNAFIVFIQKPSGQIPMEIHLETLKDGFKSR